MCAIVNPITICKGTISFFSTKGTRENINRRCWMLDAGYWMLDAG
jgi:hypothetical protein